MFRFERERLKEDFKLGGSDCSNVFAYSKHSQDDRWAVKHILTQDTTIFLKYMQEIVLGFSCDHPSILPIKGYFAEEEKDPQRWNLYMKMPRMQGDLKDILYQRNQKDLPIDRVVKYFHTLASGLEYLHTRKIAHRNIKVSNILFDKKGDIKLADISTGKFIPDDEETKFITLKAGGVVNSAPEMKNPTLQVRKMNIFKADCWSLGMIMLEICTLRPPLFKNDGLLQYIKDSLEEVERKYGAVLKKIIEGILEINPDQRKNMTQTRKTLEEQFSDIYLKQESEHLVDQYKLMKKDLKHEWKEFFDFHIDKSNGFQIQGLETKHLLDEDVDLLLKHIQKFSQSYKAEGLKCLDIALENCVEITGKSVYEILKAAGENFSDLRSLSLNFSGCLNLQLNYMLSQSSHQNLRFNQLETLSLDLKWCRKVNDEGIREFFGSFGQNLSSLKVLTIDFRGCVDITSQGLTYISSALQNIRQLTHLFLSFWNCYKIQEAGIYNLAEGLKNLTDLSQLMLDFTNCIQIEDTSADVFYTVVDTLYTIISGHQKYLEYLSLSFYGCPKVLSKKITTMLSGLKTKLNLRDQFESEL